MEAAITTTPIQLCVDVIALFQWISMFQAVHQQQRLSFMASYSYRRR